MAILHAARWRELSRTLAAAHCSRIYDASGHPYPSSCPRVYRARERTGKHNMANMATPQARCTCVRAWRLPRAPRLLRTRHVSGNRFANATTSPRTRAHSEAQRAAAHACTPSRGRDPTHHCDCAGTCNPATRRSAPRDHSRACAHARRLQGGTAQPGKHQQHRPRRNHGASTQPS